MATKNIRSRVASSDVAVSTGLHRPVPVLTDEATRKADALAKALGVGAQAFAEISARRHAKAVLSGTQAALEGREMTEEEKKRDSFVLGYESVRNERALVDLEREAVNIYQTSANRDDPQAFQAELDALFMSKYGGLDPEVDADRATF